MQIARKIKITKKRVIITCAVTAAILIFCWFQNNILTVGEYVYSGKKVSPDLDGFKIVQISDLHNAVFGRGNRRLIDKIEEQDPDLVVITGDIADSNHTDLDAAIEFCQKAAELWPCYYVTGNHEKWLSDAEQKKLFDGITKSGVVWLDNEEVFSDCGIRLIGLDDNSLADGTLEKFMAEDDQGHLTVVLAHEPQYFEDYCACGPDLVLTGHAHGGQVRLPFIGGLVAPDQGLFPEYTEGQFSQDGTVMIISRGLGNSVIPVRLFDLPEIVTVTLRSP
ncbi:MAG: metallophosphoesterase [Ruminococcus sp.]|nr:metallophosphoesterase [Ruminococcus sp.]